ncbi:DUF3040 domain-containing protein [Saccharopolyspora griseoalba]|uniref:DUF3040 domain-containing protein n=1 Tax=Saccharopolyspora griseoalba TaxID=1431848 RepID=A0ABW2LSF4_9PSEU
MLSRYEKRRLREIEKWFVQDDPRFAEYVRTGIKQRRALVRALDALIPVGLLVLVLGLLVGLPLVVFLGICCAIGGVALGSWQRWRDRERTG